jgi:hypothetical protein
MDQRQHLPLWEYPYQRIDEAHVAAGPDGRVYIADYFMKITEVKDGREEQVLKTEAILLQAPSIGKDGTVYVITGIGTPEAFRSPASGAMTEVPSGPEPEKKELIEDDEWIIVDGLKLERHGA